MRVCFGHCESAPHTVGLMLDRLNFGHVMQRFDRQRGKNDWATSIPIRNRVNFRNIAGLT